MKKKYTIQISQKITISREITAETFEDAVEQLNAYILKADVDPLVKPAKKGWRMEWEDGCEAVGVFG